ncbi:protein GAST1 [Momordica charantia]|uniref:Protein GAST1 n=1 Tax=Momordica charantia TaxID=3673 RepID=A0A6J1E399_MOMCH|nr:protein GAST1 [Momordica charantia]
MARKQTMMIFFLVMFLNWVLLVQNHAISEAPTPQPQPIGNHPGPMPGVTEGSLQPQECGPRCTDRCSKTAFKKPCMFFCQKCCAKCLCVPFGTYGNKQSCPCYNDWKTKRGGPKCP